ncbi:hypothetical protein IUY40_14010 [Flavobacterium sp. ALJ2]|uniref:hypothetical protein n=1 Tax=Flavobacterium sp. ALJ2 TaxID=2786960 RepID=UPI00189FCB11|nr:hypothetical protein [Flavobacterium sp. ALJ2]MBF7092647.1 hypothetical protein [Flavobacterium sp. ALJ2]
MKNYKITILITLLFFTINLKAQEKDSEKRIPKKYLKQNELMQYLNSVDKIKKSNTQTLPFKNLQYNKVIAYDYEGAGEKFVSITSDDGKFTPVVTKQKSLSQLQIEQVITIFTDKKTYGEGTAACFIPHMAIVFYKDSTIVFKTDICLDCNYMITSEDIPAMLHKKIKIESKDFYPFVGFTKLGKKKIENLSKELDFFYGN